jgi:hypothetical protein
MSDAFVYLRYNLVLQYQKAKNCKTTTKLFPPGETLFHLYNNKFKVQTL